MREPYSNHSVRLSVCPSVRPSVYPSTLCCNAISKISQPTNFILHPQIQDRERKTPIDFGVKWLKVTWPLTYFWKTLLLGITFLSREIGLSYLACVFLMTRPPTVPWILNMWPWPWPLTYFSKFLTLVITFSFSDIGHSYLACVFLVTRPFRQWHKFWMCDLEHGLWLWTLTYFCNA